MVTLDASRRSLRPGVGAARPSAIAHQDQSRPSTRYRITGRQQRADVGVRHDRSPSAPSTRPSPDHLVKARGASRYSSSMTAQQGQSGPEGPGATTFSATSQVESANASSPGGFLHHKPIGLAAISAGYGRSRPPIRIRPSPGGEAPGSTRGQSQDRQRRASKTTARLGLGTRGCFTSRTPQRHHQESPPIAAPCATIATRTQHTYSCGSKDPELLRLLVSHQVRHVAVLSRHH